MVLIDQFSMPLMFCSSHIAYLMFVILKVACILTHSLSIFLQMPSTIDELDAAIQDTISQANSILFLNHNVLEEYETRRKKVTPCSLYMLFHFNLLNYMMITSNFILLFCR